MLTLATAAGLNPELFAKVISQGTDQSFGFDKFASLMSRFWP